MFPGLGLENAQVKLLYLFVLLNRLNPLDFYIICTDPSGPRPQKMALAMPKWHLPRPVTHIHWQRMFTETGVVVASEFAQ